MIICNREDANKLLLDDNNLLKSDERNKDKIDYEVREIKHGRGFGTENISPSIRQLIAEEAIVSGKSHEEIAKEFGISHDAVAAYKNGATSLATYNEPNKELSEHIDAVKVDVTAKAQNKLLTAIEALTTEKIGGAKARDIAGIAKDMSAVVKNMGPSAPLIDNRKVIVYRPRQKEEDDYDIIAVNE